MRSLLRWLRRLALSALALVAIALVVALVTAHTDWGREHLRRYIEAELRDAFPGGARLAAVDGSVLGTLSLHGVELDAADHRPLLTAGTVDVSLALWPLAVRTARFDRFVGDDIRVFVRDQPPAAAAAPAPAEPSRWRVELPAVELHRAVVDVARASLALGDLDASGAATVAAGRIALSGVAHGRWSRAGGPPAPLTASGEVILDGGIRVSRAVATLGAASITAFDLAIDPDHPAGWLAIAAPAAAIAALVPELGTPAGGAIGDVVAVLDASRDGESTRLTVTAAAGDARLWAALRGRPAQRAARGVIVANSVDLAVVTRGRVGGRGHLAAAIDADPSGARGVAIAHGDIAVGDLPLRRAGGVVIGSLDDAIALALGSGDDALQLAAVARGHRSAGSFVVDQARAVASARGASVPGQRITGALAVDARLAERFVLGGDARIAGLAVASGVQARPTAEQGAGERIAIGTVRSPFALRIAHGERGPEVELAVRNAAATAVARDDLGVAVARGSFTAAILPEPRLDGAQIDATGVRRASRLLGDARVTIDRRGDSYAVLATARPPLDRLAIATQASLRRGAAGYDAMLGTTRIDTPDGAAWIGHGGSLAIPALAVAAIRLRGVALHRDGATIALGGDYVRSTGALAAHVDADRIDLSTLGLGPDGPRGLGRVTLELARRGGHWKADAALAVSGFAATAASTPVDATAHLALGPRVALDAHATGAALGDLELAFDAVAPADPFDIAGWRALDRSAIRTAAITARSVALPGLLGLLGTAPGAAASGTIDGTIDLAPGALRGDLKVRGVALSVGTLEGDVALAPADGDVRVTGAARLRGVTGADALARLAIPKHPFDPATWPRRARDLLRGGWAHVDEFAFEPTLLARLGLTRGGVALPYRGRARAFFTLGAGGGEAQLALDLLDVTGGPLAAPVSPHVEIRANPVGSRLLATLRGSSPRAGARPGTRHPNEDLALGALDANVRMTLDQWLDEPLAVLGAPVSATWTLPSTPVAPVLALLGRHELIAGTLEGSAEVRGTVAAPMLSSAQLVLRNARVAPRLGGRPVPELRELSVEGSWEGPNIAIAVAGREATGGELRVAATGRSDALDELTGTAQLTRLDIAPIAAFLPGALASAAGVVDGDLALGRVGLSGKLKITGGALPLAAAIGTLRDANAELTSDGRSVAATLDGRLGRGTIHVVAHAPADDLTAVTADVQLRQVSPITALRPIITADLKAGFHRVADQLRGEITVASASVTLPEHSGTALLDISVPADLVMPGAQPPGVRGSRAPAHPWLVVDVNPGAVRVDARELAEGIGFLGTLRSKRLEVSLGDTIGVRGTLDIESADADILGRRYILEPSALVFDGTIDPRLDIHMTHAFPELTLKVDVLGRASRPEPQFSSDVPGYSNDALFAFFLGGEPSSDTGASRDQARVAVTGAGARLVSGKLGREITKVLPVKVDAVSCEPDPAATTSAAGSCTVGKWLSERIFVAYRQHLQPRVDENTGDVQFQIHMGSNVLIEATGGDRGHYSADLLWRQRW